MMMRACTACGRPVPLSDDEVTVLRTAATAAAGVRVAELPADQSACIRALVRMGYLIKTANDDGPRGKSVLLTDHGRRWLAENRRGEFQ